VPIGLLAIPLALRRLEESYGPRAALDFPGLALGLGAVLGLVWGLVRGSSAGWARPEVAGTLAPRHPARYPLRICSLRMSACPQCWASSRSTWKYTQRSGSGPRQ
jgi:hypothetical protein